ncbi:S8 family serine peptidase [Sediminicola sp. 1XM1-17]|uniref:S8 family serine peptidase n=1 Tax=Sediminicola sp. 1XM1-17 TaxID=3127702 RepID=UPI003077759A
MKKSIFKGTAIGVTMALLIASCSDQEDQIIDIDNTSFETEESIVSQSSQIIEGSYIIVFNQKVTGDIGAKFGNDHKAARLAVQSAAEKMFVENKVGAYEISNSYSKVFNGISSKLTKEDVTKLKTDKRVAYIEKDQMITLAPPPGKGPGNGGGGSDPQETPWGIARVNGGVPYTGTNVAWILDTGIDLDHPDLNVDASIGFNAFSSGKDGRSLDDGNGHGSHVAGTIAAINNDIGVIGVAPGAKVIPVKVLDSRGSGSYSGVIAGIDYVAANGSNGDVANMSLGGPVSQAVDDAVSAAAQNGIKFVLAAGNDSDDANNHSPARVNGNNIYTISAMNSNDGWASFSNFGNPPVDYCAPGVAIKSTWKDGGYNTINGTSMAAPHAAGVLLLGNASASGTVNGDPDGSPDTIISH